MLLELTLSLDIYAFPQTTENIKLNSITVAINISSSIFQILVVLPTNLFFISLSSN